MIMDMVYFFGYTALAAGAGVAIGRSLARGRHLKRNVRRNLP